MSTLNVLYVYQRNAEGISRRLEHNIQYCFCLLKSIIQLMHICFQDILYRIAIFLGSLRHLAY